MPDTDMVVNNNNDSGHLEALKGDDFAMIYSSEGNDFQVKMGIIGGAKIKAWWFNPRNGKVLFINEYENKDELTFYPSGEPAKGYDWVLVLDNSAVNFPIPGN